MRETENHQKSYARINSLDFRGSIADGPGIRSIVYFQGCLQHCTGCQNPATWDMEGGEKVEVHELLRIIKRFALTKRITISGGEPLLQPEALASLVYLLRQEEFDIALYTGLSMNDVPYPILCHLNYIKCGRFLAQKLESTSSYYGSSNQSFIVLKNHIERNS